MTTAPIDPRDFLTQIQEIGGLDDVEDARRAGRATVTCLYELLDGDHRARLLATLPWLEFDRPEPLPPVLDAFYDRVRKRTALPPGFAREHAQIVCHALAALLARDELDDLVKALPPDFAMLFSAASTHAHPPTPGMRGSEATGKPRLDETVVTGAAKRPPRYSCHS